MLVSGIVTLLASSSWKVKISMLSEMTIGVAVRNATTAWTTTDLSGTSAPSIVKTDDGGASWSPVKNGSVGLTMGIAATKPPAALEVVSAGAGASKHSADGTTFSWSDLRLHPLLASQSIRITADKRAVQCSETGVCFSEDGGASYRCVDVPTKHAGTVRYASWPSKEVVYVVAGSWPTSEPAAASARPLTSRLALTADRRVVFGGAASFTTRDAPVRDPPYAAL